MREPRFGFHNFVWELARVISCQHISTSQLAHRHLSNEEQLKHASLSGRTARLRAVQNMLQPFQSECRTRTGKVLQLAAAPDSFTRHLLRAA